MITNLKRSIVILTCLWTGMLVTLYCVIIYQHSTDTLREAVDEARHYYFLNLYYRAWNSNVGGVYVSTEKISPNPYLHHPRRDVTMADGSSYTLVNPAYMTRMVFDAIRNDPDNQIISKLTSLNTLNPANAPDPWETAALKSFSQKIAKEKFETTVIDNKPYLRFIAPFITEQSCLKCHGQQGYKVGDIRGGISIAIPLDNYQAANEAMKRNLAIPFSLLWILGCSGIALTGRRHLRQAVEVSTYRDKLLEKVRDLEASNDHVKQLSSRLSIVMDGIPAMIAHVDTEQRYIYVNRSYAEWAGSSQDELIGRFVHEVIGEEACSQCRDCIEATLQGRATSLEHVSSRSGETVVQHISFVPQVDDQGSVTAYFAFIIDTTARKKAEVALHETEQQLYQSQKMEAIGQLAGGIAHDFNNLLQAINSFAFLTQMQLQENKLSTQFAEQIVKAGKRAAELTMGLLAFSRKQTINLKLTELNRIIEDTHKLLSRVLSEKIDFVISYHHDNLKIMVDRGQLQQVLINLATNARDAMPGGGVLRIATGKATIDDAFIAHHGFGTRGDYVTITVSDTGHGMGRDVVSHIFEPFFTTKKQGKGTGLGLSIVYGIVKQHDGFITVESRPNEGTTFRIYLQEITEEKHPSDGENQPDQTPRGDETILVVDDEEMVRVSLGVILRAHGYRVIEARDGHHAIEQFRAGNHDIDLVIMDVVMPRKNGEETLRDLRGIKPDLAALFISGYTGEHITVHDQLDDNTVLLMKPINPPTMLSTIRQLLERKGVGS